MKYSRATRRQLIMLDLIQGVVDAVRQANPSDTGIDQRLRRIDWRQQLMRSELAEINERGGIVFETWKHYQQYSRELREIQDTILECWPGSELDGREYLNAILVGCDSLAEEAGRMRQGWAEMLVLLQGLYEVLDPDLGAEEQMEVGERVGDLLTVTMEG